MKPPVLIALLAAFPASSSALRLLPPAKDQVERFELHALAEDPAADGSSTGVAMSAVLRRTIRAVTGGRSVRERFVVHELTASGVVIDHRGRFVASREELDVPEVFLVSRPDEDRPGDWFGLCLRADWDALLRAALPAGTTASGDTYDVSGAALLDVVGPRGARLARESWARATLSRHEAKRIELDALLRYETRDGAGRLRLTGRIEGAFDGESMPSLELAIFVHRPDGSHERRTVRLERSAETP